MKQTKINDLINELIELVRITKDYTAENTPIFISELLTYRVYYHAIIILSALCICLVISILLYKYLNSIVNKLAQNPHFADRIDLESEKIGIYIILVFSILIPIITIIYGISQLLKIWIAPKLYLLEYLKGFL